MPFNNPLAYIDPKIASAIMQGNETNSAQSFAPTDFVPVKPAEPVNNSSMWKIIAQYAPVFAATTAGLASKRMLPGAAGFMTGYAGELEKQRDREYEKTQNKVPLYVFDKATGKYKVQTDMMGNPTLVPKASFIRNKQKVEEANSSLFSEAGMVSVISPKGISGKIPKEDLEEAIKEGYILQ